MEQVQKRGRGRPPKRSKLSPVNITVIEIPSINIDTTELDTTDILDTKEERRGKPRTRPFGPKMKNGRPKKIVSPDETQEKKIKKNRKDPSQRHIINEDLYKKKLADIERLRQIAKERSQHKDIIIRREPITISIC